MTLDQAIAAMAAEHPYLVLGAFLALAIIAIRALIGWGNEEAQRKGIASRTFLGQPRATNGQFQKRAQ
jgi:hypothetical protein